LGKGVEERERGGGGGDQIREGRRITPLAPTPKSEPPEPAETGQWERQIDSEPGKAVELEARSTNKRIKAV
jgi:hypothetical protein